METISQTGCESNLSRLLCLLDISNLVVAIIENNCDDPKPWALTHLSRSIYTPVPLLLPTVWMR